LEQSTQPTSKRFALVHTEDYVVDLEYNDEFAIIHLPYVKKFTRSMYEDFMLTFPRIKTFLKDMGYEDVWAAIAPGDKPTGKLAERMGFELVGSSHGMDVYLIEGEK